MTESARLRNALDSCHPSEVPEIACQALIAILDVLERILDHIESDEVQL